MPSSGENAVCPQRVDDGDVSVQAHHDQDHRREVEAEGAEVGEQLAGEAAGEPEAEEPPHDLMERKTSMLLETDFSIFVNLQ